MASERIMRDVLEDLLAGNVTTRSQVDAFLYARGIEPIEFSNYVHGNHDDHRDIKLQQRYQQFEARTGVTYK
jgi:hypothetical protein